MEKVAATSGDAWCISISFVTVASSGHWSICLDMPLTGIQEAKEERPLQCIDIMQSQGQAKLTDSMLTSLSLLDRQSENSRKPYHKNTENIFN